mmetsp:Transcript_47892/g.107926  ORF Transcript_47892/g.107926 Transcript_47892/m.107926 type:complete len:221 (-) Transcript_47892:302-964(-)
MVREASKCSFRIGLHEPIVESLHAGPGPAPFITKVAAGLVSGGVAALICNPLDLTKTRLQLEATHARGSAASSGPLAIITSAVRHEGVGSLWAGTQVGVVRSMLATGSILAVHTHLKETMRSPNAGTDACCAFVASTVAVALINPADVVRTRLYSQPVGEDGVGKLYAGSVDCVRKILTVEGPSAFYKGVAAHLIRAGPHIVLTFVFIGWMKRFVGLAPL